MKSAALLILSIVLIASNAGLAQTKPAVITRDDVDQHVKTIIDGAYCPCVVVGIIDSTGPHVYTYGTVSRTEKKAPDGDTLFEIGSLTKLFTATVYSQMIEKNEVQVSTPVDSLITGMKIPSDIGNKIWLVHLVAHTSGLPLNPTNVNSPHPDNPYSGYTQRQFVDFLAKYVLPRPPGDRYAYSHVGYALLGEALARKDKKTVEQMIVDRVCMPLAMNDTRFTATADSRLAKAYTVDGDEVEYWDAPLMAGAFGLKSSANDLLKFCSAHLGLTKTPFDEAIKAMQVRQIDVDRQNDAGMGWQIGRKYGVLWHSGETGGHHTFLALLPKYKAAVVVLANSSFSYVDTLGQYLSQMAAGERPEPLGLKIEKRQAESVLEKYVGEYTLGTNDMLYVTHENRTLYVQANKQSKLKLYGEEDKLFFGKAIPCMVEFIKEEGEIVGLNFYQNGQKYTARKTR